MLGDNALMFLKAILGALSLSEVLTKDFTVTSAAWFLDHAFQMSLEIRYLLGRKFLYNCSRLSKSDLVRKFYIWGKIIGYKMKFIKRIH